MKNRLYILGMAVATMFTSCQKDADVASAPDDNSRAVAFSAESISPLSRVTGTSWDEGDAISIIALSNIDKTLLYDNTKYATATSGTTVPFAPADETIYYPEDGTSLDFMAIYPYQKDWSYGANNMIIDLSNQDGTQDAQNKVDYLESQIFNKKDGDKVEFKFLHLSSKVQITVSNHDDLSIFENLDKLTATLETKRTQFYILNKEIISSEEPTMLKMVKTTNGDKAIFTAIVAPGSMSDEIIFSDGNGFYSTTLNIDLANGNKQYNFTATVGDQGITLVELTNNGGIEWETQTDIDPVKDIEISSNDCKIYSAKGMKIFADMVNAGQSSLNVELMNDIDLEGSEENQWTAIGTYNEDRHTSIPYSGTFDGNNFEISGLYINNELSIQGLFGYTENAIIKNLGISGSITAAMTVGGIVADADATTIINCYNKTTIKGERFTAGIAGYISDSSSIINCYNTGSIKGESESAEEAYSIGGIVGSANYSVVTSCYNLANVEGRTSVGGVVGDNQQSEITYCYYNSDVFSNEPQDSEIIGYTEEYMKSAVFIKRLNNGAYIYNQTEPTTKACAWVAGKDGYQYPLHDTNSEPQYTLFDFYYDKTEDVYYIGTAKGLKMFADKVNAGETAINGKLISDIALSGEWTPISSDDDESNGRSKFYCGTFDGDGHTITGLNVNGSNSGQGLFGSCNNATIKSVKVSGTVSSSYSHAAIIAGKAWNSTFDGCETLEGSEVTGTNTGTEANSYAGIVGYAYGVTIKGCINRAKVDGYNKYVGGIVGYCSPYGPAATISNCWNSGSISIKTKDSDSGYVGGIAGTIFGSNNNVSTIVNCANIGSISNANIYLGGLVGANQGGAIYNSYNRGYVSGGASIGGIVGIHKCYTKDGITTQAYMSNCYSSITTTSGGIHLGLVIGYNDKSEIIHCYCKDSKDINTGYIIITGTPAIGEDNNDQNENKNIEVYTDNETLIDNLNDYKKNITGAETWTADIDGDGLPTFSFITE